MGRGLAIPEHIQPPPTSLSLSPHSVALRKGEGAFRLQPRELQQPPQPLDKYELRETKRRLQRGLDGSRQNLLGPRACTHLSLLHWDPFCGEHRLMGPSCPLRPAVEHLLAFLS